MAKNPSPAAGRTAANEPPIDGELVESTERALASLSSSSAATLDGSMVAILTKAELDQMVVTARANPRSIQQALEATRELACLDLQTATECGYALPRGRDEQSGKQNVITGPSVRLAEIVACQWGNCQAASRVTDVNRAEGWVEAEGVFIDFQTNYRVTARVRRSIRGKPYQGKPGKVFGDDMINVTSNAASAIAFRNAVFKGVPKPIWNRAYEDTRRIVRGDEKTLAARRVDLLVAFRDNLKVGPDKVYAILGVKGEQDIGLDELVVAAGFYSALKNNEVTLDDLVKQIAPSVGEGGPRTLAGAFDGAGDKPTAHDPETGEVKDEVKPPAQATPKAPAVTAATVQNAEVIITGPAPAGVLHFLAEADALDAKGIRLTFKDGTRWSTAKPTANLPIYTELSAPPEPEGEKSPGETQTSAAAESAPKTPTSAADTATDSSAGSGATSDGEDQETADAKPLQTEATENVRQDGPLGDEMMAASEAAADDEDDGIQEPPEFSAFRESVSGADSWLTIKAKLKSLRGTEAYKTADGATKKGLRLAAREVVEALRDTGKDPVDPRSEPEYYTLWLDGADPRDVQPVWAALIRAKAYQALPDATKDGLADATEKAQG